MKTEQMPKGDAGGAEISGEQLLTTHKLGDLEFEGFVQNTKLEQKDKEELDNLKKWLETSEPYQKYLKQSLTFDRLDGVLAEYRELTKGKKGKEVAGLDELLEMEVDNVKSKVDSYYEIVLRMQRHNQPVVRMHLDDRAWAEKRAGLDAIRRNTHNSLLVALRSMYRICTDLIPKKVGVQVNTAGLFSLPQLTDENRILAGEWAYDTAFAERIKDQIKRIDQELNEG